MKLVIELTQLKLYAQVANNTKFIVMLQVEVRVLRKSILKVATIGMTDRNWAFEKYCTYYTLTYIRRANLTKLQ
jgi:hypothetical protein